MAEKPKNAPKEKTGAKNPRDRFLTVGASRVGKAMKAIRNVKNITNRKTYDYNEGEARKAIAALRHEVDAVESAFNSALAGKATGSEKESFSFA